MLDINMPGHSGIELLGEIVRERIPTQVVMLTSDDTAETAVRAMKAGAADYLTKPFNLDEVKIVVDRIVESAHLKNEVEYLRKFATGLTHREVVGKSSTIHKLKVRCEKLADARVPAVLITGESGAGKEVFARYIHDRMQRGDPAGFAPFVESTAPPSRSPSSRASSSVTRRGPLRTPIREEGDLRAGQRRLGPPRRDRGDAEGAAGQTAAGAGRKDGAPDRGAPGLSHRRPGVRHDEPEPRAGGGEGGVPRRSVFPAERLFPSDPPSSERREDIPVLAEHFLGMYSERYGKPASRGSPRGDGNAGFPPVAGNVRELRNVVERIVVLEQEEFVGPEHLPDEIRQPRMRVEIWRRG